ncbi:MAG: hypothetical protein U1E14_19060 [Geminicoccaceae bacterium]
MVLATTADTNTADLRAEYRAAVCPLLTAADPPCDAVVLQLAGEGVPALPPPPADLARRYRIGFVPGFLAECFDRVMRPFADVERQLAGRGYDVTYFPVAGRGTAAEAGQRIAALLAALPPDPRPFILFGYSKGLVDALAFVAGHPEASRQVAAVVGIAGAANGSPLADVFLATYRQWIAGLPLPGCATGTGDEIEDLRRDVRMAWWRQHHADIRVPVFSIVATPRAGQISPGLKLLYGRLAAVEPRNDGRLIWYDQIVPGSRLLGFVNADHWGIAMAASAAYPPLRLAVRDRVPRTALVEGAVAVVAASLAADAAAVSTASPGTP